MISSYVNDFADFDSKISFIMFLHDNILACEISTVRTFALSSNSRNVWIKVSIIVNKLNWHVSQKFTFFLIEEKNLLNIICIILLINWVICSNVNDSIL